MNFKQFLTLGRETRSQAKRPGETQKEYASRCTMNDWLKVYDSNRPLALWMLRWVKFDIGRLPFHLSLTSYTYDGKRLKQLQKLLSEYSYLAGLTIPSRLLDTPVLQEIHRLSFLSELIIWTDEPFRFPQLTLPGIETLYIVNSRACNVLGIENMRQLENLKNLYLSGYILEKNMIDILVDTPLRALALTGVEISSYVDAVPNIFKDKRKISLMNCENNVVQLLLRGDDLTSVEIFIENTRPDVELDVTSLVNHAHLKNVKIRLELNAPAQYVNLFQVINAIKDQHSCPWQLILRVKRVLGVQINPVTFLYFEGLKKYIAEMVHATAANNRNITLVIGYE